MGMVRAPVAGKLAFTRSIAVSVSRRVYPEKTESESLKTILWLMNFSITFECLCIIPPKWVLMLQTEGNMPLQEHSLFGTRGGDQESRTNDSFTLMACGKASRLLGTT